MSFGTRLKERREALGLKQSELGKLLGVTGSAIGNYENSISSPKADILCQVFDVLKCDANYLFQDEMKELETDDFSVPEIKIIKKYRTLDEHGKDMVATVLDKEAARTQEQAARSAKYEFAPEEAALEDSGGMSLRVKAIPYYDLPASAGNGMLLFSDAFELIDVPESSKASFVIRVSGDSMEPVYRDGDKLLIQGSEALAIGETGIFVLNGEGFVKKQGEGRLVSLNPTYGDIILRESDDIRTRGRILGKIE